MKKIFTLLLFLLCLNIKAQTVFHKYYYLIKPDSTIITTFTGTTGSVDSINAEFEVLDFIGLVYVSPGLCRNQWDNQFITTGTKLRRLFDTNDLRWYISVVDPTKVVRGGNVIYPYSYSIQNIDSLLNLRATAAQGALAYTALQPGTSASNITQDVTHRFATDTEKSSWNAKLSSEVDGSTTNELELPSMSGQSGKVLSNNGSSATWITTSTGDYYNTVNVAGGAGQAVFYLTSDKTSTGTALYSTVDAVMPIINDATQNYTYGWSYNAGTKALTVTAKTNLTAVISLLTVVLGPTNVANGTPVQVIVKGH